MEDQIFLLQCMLCKKRDFIQDYEGAPLTCTNCGTIDSTEDIPNLDHEIDNLVNSLKSTDIQHSQAELEMIRLAEESKKEQSIEDLMSQLNVKPQRRPKKRESKK